MIEVGPLEILPEEHLARPWPSPDALDSGELRLLTELGTACRPDHGRSEGALPAGVGKGDAPWGSSVDVYVRKLRVKLEQAVPDWRFIHTHFGSGYRLTAERQRTHNGGSHVGNN